MIKAILFDCDGTLVDSETLSACATDYAFKHILKRPLTDAESKGLLGRPANKILEEWFQEKGKEIFEEATNHFHCTHIRLHSQNLDYHPVISGM